MKPSRSITETPNALTADIDLESPLGIVRTLRQTDGQIFGGYLGYPGLYDTETIDALASLAERAAQTIANPGGHLVLSGAGTSGRLAVFATRVFNQRIGRAKTPRFHYLMAGGDSAFIQAQEGAEDSPDQAVADLRAVIDAPGVEDVFYVGITCGMSAPYIAGQLEEMMSRDQGHAVLLGFNPVELARNTPIEGWHSTFRDIAQRFAKSPRATILNPIIGPEPITGSTRMKSGSATKILLEVLFHAAVALSEKKRTRAALRKLIVRMLRAYESAYRDVYMSAEKIGKLVAAGGAALRAHGHIYYLGAAGTDASGNFVGDTNAALLGLIDASECPPTYGADFEDVRGFVQHGWRALFPYDDRDLSTRGGHYRISIDDFRRDKLPLLDKNDLCVFLGDFADREDLMGAVKSAGAQTAAVVTRRGRVGARITIPIPTGRDKLLGDGPLELQIKLILNALTTGAHILAGKVFGNRMVDLRISNNKLFHRTVGIIGDLIGVSEADATTALLRSVYETDSLSDDQRAASVRDHIEAAKRVSKVVPKALLMATTEFTYREAESALKSNPIVRAAIADYVT